MQLASNGSRGEDDSETEPILSDSHIIEESQETTLYEIRTVVCDTSAVTDIEADENCSLVNPEQPQCRICLEIEECRANFLLRANVPSDRWWLRLKFQFLVARDHAFIFIVVQMIVAVLGILVYKFYGEELREMFGYQEHPYAFYIMAVLAIILVGLLYGFFIAIICGQRINERHHHVLAKQELTKEYIVEDRESKDVPELDPSHISELRMLGLY